MRPGSSRTASDLTGWLMLIRSYAMLQLPDKIQEAAASARKQFASDPEALKQIDAVVSIAEQEPAPAGANLPPRTKPRQRLPPPRRPPAVRLR